MVTGVGFLGAGAIIHRNSGTRGLTTAATIWIVMAIGLACGSFNFILAIGGTALIVIVLTIFRKVEAQINQKAPLFIVKAKQTTPISSKVLAAAKEFGCSITELTVEPLDAEEVEATFLLSIKNKDFNRDAFVERLEKEDGVIQVSVMNNHKS